MHVYRLFITPGELRAYCATAGLGVEELVGLRPLLMNLDILLREETGLPVLLADDPLTAVVLGSGRALDQLNLLREVTLH